MKLKNFAVLFVIVMLFLSSGCGSSTHNNFANTTNNNGGVTSGDTTPTTPTNPTSGDATPTNPTDPTSGDNTISEPTEKIATADGEHALELSSGSETFTNYYIQKTGGPDEGSDNYDFYGTNAAVFASGDAKMTLKNSIVSTDASYANAVFAYGNASIDVSDTKIYTHSHNSGGIMVTGGGTINASNLNIITDEGSSAAIRSDRGGGNITVNGGTYETSGSGSPAIYSTANITVSNATLTSNTAQGVVIEGKNSVTLNDTIINANHNTLHGNDTTRQAVSVYQSFSGDAATGTGTFTMNGGEIINASGDIFMVTNTVATITINDVDITNNDDTGYFLRAEGQKWGTSGENGGQVNFYAVNQQIDGNIFVDENSALNMYLSDGSNFTGTINGDGTVSTNSEFRSAASSYGEVYVEVEEGSTWVLTESANITSLKCAEGGVNLNGHTLEVNNVSYTGGASEGTPITISTGGNDGGNDDNRPTPPDLPNSGDVTPPERPGDETSGDITPEPGNETSGDVTPEPSDETSGDITPEPSDETSGDVTPEPSDNESDDVAIGEYPTADDITTNTTLTATTDGEHALELTDGTTATFSNYDITKTGGPSGGSDDYDFYGTNAAVFASSGSNLTLTDSIIDTDASYANAVFAYGGGNGDNTIINISNSVITTHSHNSGGIMVTGGGILNAEKLNVVTESGSSAAIRSDRGGGTLTVNGGHYETLGSGSPAIYSTANITVKNAELVSGIAQGVVIEGANSVTLSNSKLEANHTQFNGQDSSYQGVMIYQSGSGDASNGKGSFTMTDGTLTNANGAVFFVTNTAADITLNDVDISNNDDEDILLRAASAAWGSSGSNGGNVNFYANDQLLTGNIIVDDYSALNLYLADGSVFSGAIDAAGDVYVEIESFTKWTLTGDSYITALTCEADGVDLNGYTLYINGTEYTENTASEGTAIEFSSSSSGGNDNPPSGGDDDRPEPPSNN